MFQNFFATGCSLSGAGIVGVGIEVAAEGTHERCFYVAVMRVAIKINELRDTTDNRQRRSFTPMTIYLENSYVSVTWESCFLHNKAEPEIT